MFCPSCGKQLPDQGKFCLHCGASIAVSPRQVSTPSEWEHKYFLWIWKKGQGGKYYLNPGHNEQLARLFYWNDVQGKVLSALQLELDKGWQALTEVGPSAITFKRYNGNPGWLELSAVRVTLRKPRTTPYAPHELSIIGKWQHVDSKGQGIGAKLVLGLTNLTGGQIKEFEFFRQNLFSGHHPKFGTTGVYNFTDEHHIKIETDAPKDLSLTAELNGTFNEMIIHDVIGVDSRYRKMP